MIAVLGYRTATSAAKQLGLPRHVLMRAIAKIAATGEEPTRESVLVIADARDRRKGGPRRSTLGHPTIAAAAAAYDITTAALSERILSARREGKPLTREHLIDAYGPQGRRRGRKKGRRMEATWRRIESKCGKLIEEAVRRDEEGRS